MRFVEYIDARFQEAKMRESTAEIAGKMDMIADAEMKALHMALTWYRWIMKICLLPFVLLGYPAVLLGLKRKPEPVIVNRLKEQKKAEAEAKRVVDQMNAESKESNGSVEFAGDHESDESSPTTQEAPS